MNLALDREEELFMLLGLKLQCFNLHSGKENSIAVLKTTGLAHLVES